MYACWSSLGGALPPVTLAAALSGGGRRLAFYHKIRRTFTSGYSGRNEAGTNRRTIGDGERRGTDDGGMLEAPFQSPMFRLVRGLLIAIAAVYLVIVGALWYWQATFIFRPSRTVETTPADVGVKFDTVTMAFNGDRLAGWWVPSEHPQARTLLYLHGNANNVCANVDGVVALRRTGLNVFIFDYRGYGESTGGPPRERLVYEDAERAWTYLVAERHIPPADIVIYGHSLGGAIAIDLAGKHPEAGALITESTMTSIADVADGIGYAAFLPVRLILTERFDALSRMGSVRLPKLILQGEADTMHVPMARRLYDAASEPKQLAVIPGGGHNDSAEMNPTAYFGALNGFLSQYHFEPDGATAQ